MTRQTAARRRPAGISALEEARSLAVGAQALQARAQQRAQQERVQRAQAQRARAVSGTDATDAKVQQALDTARRDRTLPTSPAISTLLPGGALRGGASYCVQGSTALAMALMAGPSTAGAWCGVVGLPTFGAEAAKALGVDLERLVLVPEPGREWLGVVAALLDALTVVVVGPPTGVTSAQASRLAARMRQREAVLLAVGSWPGSEARLAVSENSWVGLGCGHGRLSARQVTVVVTGRGAAVRPRHHQLWLPDADGSVRVAEQHPGHDQPAWRHEAVG